MLSPKAKYNISRIAPFGFIWLACGWVFLINDLSLTRNGNLNPETDITITLPVFVFASLAMFILGILIGTMEVLFFYNRFRGRNLLAKFGIKFLIYVGILFITIMITYPIAGAIESGVSPLNYDVLQKLLRFLTSMTFLSTSIQLAIELFLSLIYSSISENLGHNVLRNFFTGKYHTPKVEKRIFMFMDMKDSTSIAEKLGHVKYFDFLQQYYELFSDPIINHQGEVYQYIGDEIVITWDFESGVTQHRCIHCFYEMKKSLQSKRAFFLKEYGVFPDFKAGMHVGDVTTGELGALKKEIVYTGDVLNTTARIQSLCNKFENDLIISKDLVHACSKSSDFLSVHLGNSALKGKSYSIDLFSITRTDALK